MRNYVQPGDSMTISAPAAVLSGEGVKVGQLFGVATGDAENGAELVIKTMGVFDLAKAGSQAWTVGALVYWDADNDRCTTVAAGNLLIGCAVAAVGSGAGETTGRVRLNGIAAADEAA